VSGKLRALRGVGRDQPQDGTVVDVAIDDYQMRLPYGVRGLSDETQPAFAALLMFASASC
jgi:hypothetical protein